MLESKQKAGQCNRMIDMQCKFEDDDDDDGDDDDHDDDDDNE